MLTLLASALLARLALPVAEAHSYDGWRTYASPYGASGSASAYAFGTVYVTNQASQPVTVMVDGQVQTVGAGQSTSFRSHAGDVSVRATYRQFGVDRVLTSRTVAVPGYRAASVVLAQPTTSLVRVTNDTGAVADVQIDGQVYAELAPDQSRLITLRLGRHDLAMVADGRSLDHACLDVEAFGSSEFVARRPREDDVAVLNPLPIPVRVTTDTGIVRTVNAGSQTVFEDMPVGPFHARVERLSGERVDDVSGLVSDDRRLTLTVDAPSTGLVALSNPDESPLRAELDDRTYRCVEARQTLTLDLPLGEHHVELFDARGDRVLNTWIEVDPYATSRLAAPDQDREFQADADDAEQARGYR